MTRSVFAAAISICLMVSAAAAQTNNYWLAVPPAAVTGPSKPPPPPEIPNVPFAPGRNITLAATITIGKDFKLLGPWAPLWLGSNAVALLGTRHGRITLLAWYGEHFASSRVEADPSTVEDGTILDMAVSRDGKRLAIAAASGGKLQVWLRDTQGATPAAVAAAIYGSCDKAGIAWLDDDTLAVGARFEPVTPPPAQSPVVTPGQEQQPQTPAEPTRGLYLVQPGMQQPPARLDMECLQHLDPTTLAWSPDANYAVARSDEQGKWILIDRAKKSCSALAMRNIAPMGFIEWDEKSRRFLFTATPVGAADPGHIGVMEYTVAPRKARLLASPATAAAYVGGGKIAALGSQRLNAAAMAANPEAPFPAEIAWIDPDQSQIEIVPTGLTSTAAELLHGQLRYSAANRMLAAGFQTPHPKGAFTALLWLSAAAHNGGVLGTGKMGTMLESWSPDGTKLAVLAGLPDHPTLAVVEPPSQSER